MFRTMIRGLALFIMLSMNTALKAEQEAPDFTLKNLYGNSEHSLSDYRGKVVYLDFWASWCGPCRKSLPALDALQTEMASQDFEVLAVNLDMSEEEAKVFLEEYPVSYTVLRDGSGGVSRKYDLVGLPSSVLIDKRGIIVSSFQGFHPSHIDKLRKALPYLLE